MNAIFASKIYKASTRKDRIHAAMAAPGNLNLVQQLADSLDEEYQTPENLGIDTEAEEQEQKTAESSDLFVDEDIDPEKDLVTVDDLASKMTGGGGHHSALSHSSPSGPSEEGDSDKPDTDTSDLMPDSPMTEEPKKTEEPAEASTKITSSTDVKINPVPAEALDLNVLKATLNNREDLAGVTRVAQKEKEIWIYYKDEVNLNNIMIDVVELLANQQQYKCFTFNRLARSDNAIVFEITLESYQYPERSVEEVLEEQK